MLLKHLVFPEFVQRFEYKIQDFFQTLFQNNNFLFQMINTDLKKARTKLFSWCNAKNTAEKRPDWIRHDQNEKKKFTSEALVIALKEKTEDFFYHISSLFPGLEN